MTSKWIKLGHVHINTDLLTVFFWRDGGLVLYHVNGKNVKLPDPDYKLYVALCRRLNMPHWTEEEKNEEL